MRRFRTQAVQLFGQRFDAVIGAMRVQHHIPARGMQLARDGGADAPRRTRDQYHLGRIHCRSFILAHPFPV
jgi:hypothetical protein